MNKICAFLARLGPEVTSMHRIVGFPMVFEVSSTRRIKEVASALPDEAQGIDRESEKG